MQFLDEYEQIFESIPKTNIPIISEIYAKKAREGGLDAGLFDQRYRQLTGRQHGVEKRALRRELPEDKRAKAERCIEKIKTRNAIVIAEDIPIKTEKQPELDPIAKYWGFIAGAKIAREIADILQAEADKYQQ